MAQSGMVIRELRAQAIAKRLSSSWPGMTHSVQLFAIARMCFMAVASMDQWICGRDRRSGSETSEDAAKLQYSPKQEIQWSPPFCSGACRVTIVTDIFSKSSNVLSWKQRQCTFSSELACCSVPGYKSSGSVRCNLPHGTAGGQSAALFASKAGVREN